MEGMIISFMSIILPLVAAIICAKGPKKYKNIYINFLFLSIGITLGLFFMCFINHYTGKKVAQEFLPPTDLTVGIPSKIGDGMTVEYEEWIPNYYFIVFKTSKETKDVQLKGEGDVQSIFINKNRYDVKLLLGNPGGKTIDVTINKYK